MRPVKFRLIRRPNSGKSMSIKTMPTACFTMPTRHPLARTRPTLPRKLQHERVAIIGIGGTGSYVLDLVAKTWVREIHLFDDDPFLQHNAFRSPGPFCRAELEGGPIKSVFHAQRYSRMRKGLFSYAACIDGDNVHQLAAFSTAFLCMDGHPIKAQILETCMAHDTSVVDTAQSSTCVLVAAVSRLILHYIPLPGR